MCLNNFIVGNFVFKYYYSYPNDQIINLHRTN